MLLTLNKKAPTFRAQSVSGNLISPEDFKNKKVLIKFHRFAGCPVCQRQIHEYLEHQEELNAAGIETIVFMHSGRNKILTNFKEVPGLHIIGDKPKVFYKLYGSKFLWGKVFSVATWGSIFISLLKGYFPHFNKFEGGILGVPSDFLLDEKGTVVQMNYGKHFGDSWSVSDVLKKV